MRRRALVVLIAALGAFAGLLAGSVLVLRDTGPPAPSALKVRYDRVEAGMTRDQAECLLGANSGAWLSKKDGGAAERGLAELHWGAEDGVAAVLFDGRTVVFKRWDPRPAPRSAVRRWLDAWGVGSERP